MDVLPSERRRRSLLRQIREHPVAAAAPIVLLAGASVLLAAAGAVALLLYDRPIGDGDGCKGWDAPVSGLGLLSLAAALFLTALAGAALRREAVGTGTRRKPIRGRAILVIVLVAAGVALLAFGRTLPCREYHLRS